LKELVLVVDDNPIVRSNICELIETREYKTLQAADGEEALSIIRSKKVNLIISDWMMPKMDGITLLINLKKNNLLRSVPFIFVTVKTSLEDKLIALELGADDFLSKPFSTQELLLRCKNRIQAQKSKLSEELISDFSPDEIQTKEEIFLVNLKLYIADNYSNENLKLAEIADYFNMGISNFQKYVKKLTNKSIFELLFKERLIMAHKLVLEKKLPISEIATICGFKNTYFFTIKYKEHFGILPSKSFKK
jgi:DNA-binding response OmpR family regulator